jgi:hypothetical protein
MRHLSLLVFAALLSVPAHATIKVTEKIAVQLPTKPEVLSERISNHSAAAVKPDPLTQFVYSALITAQAGSGLTLDTCQERLARLDGMLRGMGYRARSTRTIDEVSYSRWYHPDREVSVLSMMGEEPGGHYLNVVEYPGLLRWNEFYLTP